MEAASSRARQPHTARQEKTEHQNKINHQQQPPNETKMYIVQKKPQLHGTHRQHGAATYKTVGEKSNEVANDKKQG
jgi:hypothetical protein